MAADGEGSAARFVLAEHGCSRPADGRDPCPTRRAWPPWRRSSGAASCPPSSWPSLAEHDLTGRRRAHRPARPRQRDARGFFDDLKPGDYVVHHQHGVARYGGMVKRAIGGVERDYLLLEYRGDDKLYVPSDQIDAVRHYTGGDTPSLTGWAATDWQKAKARVRSAVAEIAQELVVLYQKRVTSPGHAFAPDTPWQRSWRTPSPTRRRPTSSPPSTTSRPTWRPSRPMDRLVCGDVGFGKTEVAIRAAFKAVQDGKQVAVLVPTTLLAQQHHQTFSRPLRRATRSGSRCSVRFLTTAQAEGGRRRASAAARSTSSSAPTACSPTTSASRTSACSSSTRSSASASATRRQIKQLKADVDVLTLTATPIPRTLEMSLTGIRDLTLLNTPPADRQPILTYVGEYDERAVGRGDPARAAAGGPGLLRAQPGAGHRARRRPTCASWCPRPASPSPTARWTRARSSRSCSTSGRASYDVLVCTTIIESGIDMPTVNTLVVDRADLLGLGQLHQLRGRVGRAGQRAYAYLFTPPDRSLSEEAYERLKTIGEATELGSGFKIAMRDLEIRGAGNLLGTGQSGHIAAVGYDLYCQMVTEAVAELKGEEVREPAEIKLDLPLDANLPRDYVHKEELRLEAYRRLAAVTDRRPRSTTSGPSGRTATAPCPTPAEALLAVARLRAECCQRTGVREVRRRPGARPSAGPAHVAKLGPLDLRREQADPPAAPAPQGGLQGGHGQLQSP